MVLPRAGFTSAGLSQGAAAAVTFVQRLVAASLPPLWGWVTLVWIRREHDMQMMEDWRETSRIDPIALR